MTALIVMLAVVLAALVWLWLSLRRNAKRLAALTRAELATWVRIMRDAGFTETQRFATMRDQGLSVEEIAQAERDAQ